MSFRLLPISVTLIDLERQNGPYFALVYRIWYANGFYFAFILHYFTEFVYDIIVKRLLRLSRFQYLLLIVCDHIVTTA